MATFLVKNRIKIRRQAGDDCDVVFNVPDVFQMAGTEWKFRVHTKNTVGNVIFEKTGSAITVNGQRIEIAISRTETMHHEGVYDWELEATKDGKKITIGLGDFELIKTYII